MSMLRLYLKALWQHWWGLMGCAAFTLLGIYIAATNRSNTWIVRASFALGAIMFFAASYLAWKREHDARAKAEAELNAGADIRGTIWVTVDAQNPYGNQTRRGSQLRYVCDCANYGRKACQINRARLVFHPPNNAPPFEHSDSFWSGSTVEPGEQLKLNREPLIEDITPMELQQCGVDVYLIDSVGMEYRNTVTKVLPWHG